MRVYPRISLQGGYASGVEDFDRFSIDRTGDFRAHTFSGGARVYLPTMTAIIGQYEYQTRSRDTKRDMGRVTVSLAQTF
ncbi:MAG: hypothetical protein O2930_07000 [Acidobacteria bacterium]|nr:hypothetical protein [Acidobacteriota bacterium]